MRKRRKVSAGERAMDIIIYTLLVVLVVICLYPVWYCIAASFATSTEVQLSKGMMLWPKKFTLEAYRIAFENPRILSGFKWSVLQLGLALPFNMTLTLLCGFVMASKNMFWKKPILFIIMFTMWFSGGLIPEYLNVKSLGLTETIWSLVLPGALSVYNSIICKTAIEAIPESLSESAYIDGATPLKTLVSIIVPLMKPTLAVLLLYYGVGHWNSWFAASIYITDPNNRPIQNVLHQLLTSTSNTIGDQIIDFTNDYAETIKYSTIVISSLPIMCVYPFLQKYFAKGVMIGAVKG